jgi:hypothetical protein
MSIMGPFLARVSDSRFERSFRLSQRDDALRGLLELPAFVGSICLCIRDVHVARLDRCKKSIYREKWMEESLTGSASSLAYPRSS